MGNISFYEKNVFLLRLMFLTECRILSRMRLLCFINIILYENVIKVYWLSMLILHNVLLLLGMCLTRRKVLRGVTVDIVTAAEWQRIKQTIKLLDQVTYVII